MQNRIFNIVDENSKLSTDLYADFSLQRRISNLKTNFERMGVKIWNDEV